MLEIYAERVANRLIETTKSKDIKSIELASLDFGKLIEFIMQLLQMLAPFFMDAPTDKAEYDEWAGEWADALEGGWRARRKLSWKKRLGLAVFERRVRKAYGRQVCKELDVDEFLAVTFRVACELTPEEFGQLYSTAVAMVEEE